MTSTYREHLEGYVRDVWNQGEISSIGKYLSEDFVFHDPYEPEMYGLDDATQWLEQMQSTFANSQVRIEDTVEEGEYLACRLHHTGVHEREFLGREPTGAGIANPAMVLWRAKDGLFCEAWQHWDALGVRRQIDDASGVEALPEGLDFEPGPPPRSTYHVASSERISNKETVRTWMDGAWNKGQLDLVDECFAEDMWFWDPFGPLVLGREGFRQWARQIDTAFPTRSLSIDHVIAEGGKTAYRVTLRAKQEGSFIGISPTGRDIEASAMIVAIHENGCYKRAYQIFDVLKVLQDIGEA